jgi:A/G-specific adenine glycosylase
VETGQPWPTLQHGFSHFRLDITPMPARLRGGSRQAMECVPTVWYNPEHPDQRGLAAPVKNLLQRLRAKT